jgi:hypothetical protein
MQKIFVIFQWECIDQHQSIYQGGSACSFIHDFNTADNQVKLEVKYRENGITKTITNYFGPNKTYSGHCNDKWKLNSAVLGWTQDMPGLKAECSNSKTTYFNQWKKCGTSKPISSFNTKKSKIKTDPREIGKEIPAEKLEKLDVPTQPE